MFRNKFGVNDESINPGNLLLPRHKNLFSNFLCQKLLHCDLEKIPQKKISNPYIFEFENILFSVNVLLCVLKQQGNGKLSEEIQYLFFDSINLH